MSREELDALLKAAANPDTAAEALTNLRDKAGDLITNFEALTSAKAETDKQIADLRDANMRLFLRAGGSEQKPPEEDERDIVEVLREKYIAKE